MTLAGQFSTTAGALVTVNVAVQVLGGSQALETVYVIDVLPPQYEGAFPTLLVIVALHQTLNVDEFFDVLNLESMTDCARHAASI